MRPSEIKVHVRKLKSLIATERKKAEGTEMRFVALSEEEMIAKLMRVKTPFMFAFLYPSSLSPGSNGIFSYWVYNPDPVTKSDQYAFAYVGLNSDAFNTLDTRFLQVVQPEYPGLSLLSKNAGIVFFTVSVPAQIETGTYFLNVYLFQRYPSYFVFEDNIYTLFAVK